MEIDIVFNEQGSSQEMAKRIKQRLSALHGREDFTLFTQEDMLATLDKILGLLTLVVAGLGGISLLVGGIGVLTIMTTVLRERTAEIGLLCALGCTRKQLLSLFLGEAIYLSSLGGLLGLLIAFALLLILRLFVQGLPIAFSPLYMSLALLVSAAVGLIAGISPAHRASQLHPIEALRDE